MQSHCSSPVDHNNAMEENHQALTDTGPQISPPIPERLPMLHSWLAQDLRMTSLVGPRLKSPPAVLSSVSGAWRLGYQNKETAGGGNITRPTKSDLDGGCVLPRWEENSDLVMVPALYSSVNMETEVIWWEEEGGGEGWRRGRQRGNKGEKTH